MKKNIQSSQNAMEFRQGFTNFIVILKESLKLINKNAKFIAKITAFSLVTPSLLLLSFIYFIQSFSTNLANADSNQSLTKVWLLILIVEILFLVAIVAISLSTNVAMIFVLAASYTTSNNNLSSRDVFSKIKTTWRKQLSASRQVSRRTIPYFILIAVLTTLIQFYSNLVTIFVGVLIGVAAFVYYLYYSVIWALTAVVVVVEQSSGKEAVERAEVLVEGQRLDGFVVNLFFNLVFLVLFLVYWLIMSGEAFTNMTVFGLFIMNCSVLLRVFVLPAYTVLYFQCKKQRGEEIEAIGGFQYTKVANDIV